MTALLFIAGATALILGAELLVRGAAHLAVAAGLTPLVIGLTVVAFGTSAPELAVTAGAASTGQGDMAVGNVVGSNIFNVLFILGTSAIIAPLVVSHDLVRLDVPVMIGVSVLVLVLALDGRVGRLEGLALFAGAVGYTGYLVRRGRRDTARPERLRPPPHPGANTRRGGAAGGRGEVGFGVRRLRWVADLALIGGGFAFLVLGGRWLVRAAVETAIVLGVSELVIGLTIVAAGTSLPELATSILASLRGQRDIAVGNVVGSNTFNLLAVLGFGSVVAPDGIPVTGGALSFDLPVMIGVAVATLPIFFTGYLIARWEGFVFLGYYVAYTAFLVLDAAGHAAAAELGVAIIFFVLPLTAITLGVLTLRSYRSGRSPPDR